MKLEQQVTNLELSKRLKELGVPQESYFYWVYRPAKKKKHMPKFTQIEESYSVENLQPEWQKKFIKSDMERGLKKNDAWIKWLEGFRFWSAFTVAELGELLQGVKLNENPMIIISYKGDPHWYCEPKHGNLDFLPVADTEADVRAKMLIYLLENKLINVANQ